MTTDKRDLLAEFEAQELKAENFGHQQHLQVAFEMLQKYDYLEACTRYANTIKIFAANAGAPEKFNVTITFAFLSLIAERMSVAPEGIHVDHFLACNQDLLDRSALGQWYTPEQLQSDFARSHFLLPTKAA